MATVRIIVQIVFMILSVIMTMGKNKGRSMEGMLVKITRVLLFLFLAISAVLNIGSFQ